MVVYATDGLNKRANLTLLDDDQHFFPDYYGTILARSDVFERFAEDAPGLKETIQLLNEQFTDELMSELTYRVARRRTAPCRFSERVCAPRP